MGVHQLLHLGTPPHAAVNDTVDVAPRRARRFSQCSPEESRAKRCGMAEWRVQFSYPDWIWNLFVGAWGEENPQLQSP